MLTSTGPGGQTHWGDSAANNPTSATNSADAQLKVSFYSFSRRYHSWTMVFIYRGYFFFPTPFFSFLLFIRSIFYL